MVVYRKFKICEKNLNWAEEQLYRINGRYPTRQEAAEWFQEWAREQPRSYQIHPLWVYAAFFGPLFLFGSIASLLDLEPTGVVTVLAGACALAASIGLLALLFKYESYKWERLIAAQYSRDEMEMVNYGITEQDGIYQYQDARFSHLRDAVKYAKRVRVRKSKRWWLHR